MSTEHQKYSTENQAEAIRRYAEQRGIEIVRTYADEGRSGLKFDDREAIQRLIADVENGRADFGKILVYDVSRWGRFQDVDEGAYLEHICTRAGIAVHYCAEQFENDGSLSATIIKSMKRAMAGEYSRELSAKTFAGHCRLASLGFRQGGVAGFGLRRRMLDEHRQVRGDLRRGEYKYLQSDRVILVPGPADEVLTVRRMYRLFVEERQSERRISALLNQEGVKTDLGRAWAPSTVREVLTNEKYLGNNVYSQTSFKLRKKRTLNPPKAVIRADGAFTPVIDHKLFQAARAIIEERNRRPTDEEMLEPLAALLKKTGWLSELIINGCKDVPSSWRYRRRFGSLARAYELIGFDPERDFRYIETNRFLHSLHAGIVAEAVTAIERSGSTVLRDAATDLLTINGEFTASILLVGCTERDGHLPRWTIRFASRLRPDITIAVRMGAGNREVLDYYILPRLDFAATDFFVSETNALHIDAYRFTTLQPFLDLTMRTNVGRST